MITKLEYLIFTIIETLQMVWICYIRWKTDQTTLVFYRFLRTGRIQALGSNISDKNLV
jgi:hypothetical protein